MAVLRSNVKCRASPRVSPAQRKVRRQDTQPDGDLKQAEDKRPEASPLPPMVADVNRAISTEAGKHDGGRQGIRASKLQLGRPWIYIMCAACASTSSSISTMAGVEKYAAPPSAVSETKRFFFSILRRSPAVVINERSPSGLCM